jgi:hypothetical protein
MKNKSCRSHFCSLPADAVVELGGDRRNPRGRERVKRGGSSYTGLTRRPRLPERAETIRRSSLRSRPRSARPKFRAFQWVLPRGGAERRRRCRPRRLSERVAVQPRIQKIFRRYTSEGSNPPARNAGAGRPGGCPHRVEQGHSAPFLRCWAGSGNWVDTRRRGCDIQSVHDAQRSCGLRAEGGPRTTRASRSSRELASVQRAERSRAAADRVATRCGLPCFRGRRFTRRP